MLKIAAVFFGQDIKSLGVGLIDFHAGVEVLVNLSTLPMECLPGHARTSQAVCLMTMFGIRQRLQRPGESSPKMTFWKMLRVLNFFWSFFTSNTHEALREGT